MFATLFLFIIDWRMPSDQNPALTGDDLMRAVEIKRCNGGAANGGYADYKKAIITPAKMILPTLHSRMVQVHDLTTFWIRRL